MLYSYALGRPPTIDVNPGAVAKATKLFVIGATQCILLLFNTYPYSFQQKRFLWQIYSRLFSDDDVLPAIKLPLVDPSMSKTKIGDRKSFFCLSIPGPMSFPTYC